MGLWGPELGRGTCGGLVLLGALLWCFRKIWDPTDSCAPCILSKGKGQRWAGSCAHSASRASLVHLGSSS